MRQSDDRRVDEVERGGGALRRIADQAEVGARAVRDSGIRAIEDDADVRDAVALGADAAALLNPDALVARGIEFRDPRTALVVGAADDIIAVLGAETWTPEQPFMSRSWPQSAISCLISSAATALSGVNLGISGPFSCPPPLSAECV